MSVTQELVDNVIAAGGALVVPAKDWGDRDSEGSANMGAKGTSKKRTKTASHA